MRKVEIEYWYYTREDDFDNRYFTIEVSDDATDDEIMTEARLKMPRGGTKPKIYKKQ